MRRRKGKRFRAEAQVPVVLPTRANQMWTMDFTRDTLASGAKFHTLNLMDGCTREALWIEVDTSLPGPRVVQVLDNVAQERGFPEAIQVDNGPEFLSRVVEKWADAHGVTLHFIDPGKPVQNAFIESFNGKFRDECLNQSWYTNLEDAWQVIEAWRVDYNTVRPHSSLGYLTPVEYAAIVAARPASPPRRSSQPRQSRTKRICNNPEVLTYEWIKTGGRSPNRTHRRAAERIRRRNAA